jgi:hypothetical protein
VTASSWPFPLELVGPKGYDHGWHFVGVPGSNEHANALADLGEAIGSKSPVAMLAMQNAGHTMQKGQYKLAAGHIKNAQWFARRQAPEYSKALRQAASSMKGIKEDANSETSPRMPQTPVSERPRLLRPGMQPGFYGRGGKAVK